MRGQRLYLHDHAGRFRRAPVVIALISLVALLSGCVSYSAQMKVSNGLTVTGTVELAIDSDTYDALSTYGSSGGMIGNLPTDFDAYIDELNAMSDRGVSAQRTSDSSTEGVVVHLDAVIPETLQDPTFEALGFSGFSLTKDNGRITLDMPQPLYAAAGAGGSSLPGVSSSSVDTAEVTLTFPGEILEAQGAQIQGKTAAFDLAGSDTASVHVVAEAGTPWWLWIAVVAGIVVLLIVIALVVLIIIAKRRSQPQTQATAQWTANDHGRHPGHQPSDGCAFAHPATQPAVHPTAQPSANGHSSTGGWNPESGHHVDAQRDTDSRFRPPQF